MKLTRQKLRSMILEAVDPVYRASKFEQVPGLSLTYYLILMIP
jgi:hypothetical protein